jgi:hypothetical protein
MNKILIKKQGDHYFVQCNDASYERQQLADVLNDSFITDYREEAVNIMTGIFDIAETLIIIVEADAPVIVQAITPQGHSIDTMGYSVPDALVSVLLSLALHRVAQALPDLR